MDAMPVAQCARFGRLCLLITCAIAAGIAAPTQASFVTFETGQARPLALSPDGTRLFAINTPDARLEIFNVDGTGALTHTESVPVGMEPCAVAARSNSEVWVVNHLSDSVSVLDVSSSPAQVVRTLLVGDEPRDIVIANTVNGDRAFITTAHRGQNTGLQATIDTVLRTQGIGRADVWVFDPDDLGTTLAGTPKTILTLFGDTPRALAVTPDGGTVYAAVFHSGNQTTTVTEGAVCDGFGTSPCGLDGVNVPGGLSGGQVPGGLPPPSTNFAGAQAPETGLVVKFNNANNHWEDNEVPPRNWTNAVRFGLPDLDVFTINANADPPVAGASFAHVGTVLFNMIVNPVNSKVYVTNTDAHNEVRFEGPGTFGGSTVRGHLHEARITVLDGSNVLPRHLNKHIDYNDVPQPLTTKFDSLATPMGMAINSAGTTLYVAAFGSATVGVFNTAQLENDTFVPGAGTHINVSGGGPSGLALNEAKNRLYVLTRFDNSVSVIDTTSTDELAHLPLYNPEPANVVDGRPLLYDATFTSSNGEASCSSCHIFGDFDSLGWDLGNPDDIVRNNPNPGGPIFGAQAFHPMKGPMTTQTLRGLDTHGPMHWRGDRTGAYAAPNIQPNSGGFNEHAAFEAFNVAFAGLLGRDEGPLSTADMNAFTDFILEVTLPPNPIRNLANNLTTAQQNGHDFFFGPTSDVVANCDGCHVLNPSSGFFGTDGTSTFENEPQELKVPHLRNLYQKVGMFGFPNVGFVGGGSNAFQGNQVRGFGFLHDGSVDTLFRFHNAVVFSFPGGDPQRRDVESFMFAFDTNLAPIVGQQVTLTDSNGSTVGSRLNLLIARAALDECDLIVKGTVDGLARGWVRRNTDGRFHSDRAAEPPLIDADLRDLALVAGQDLMYTCVPPGSGERAGVDRDEDGYLDRDELDAGSDPADPNSIPTPTCSSAPLTCRAAGKGSLLIKTTSGREKLTWKWLRGAQTDPNAFGDPVGGSTRYGLCIYSGTGNQLVMEMEVPPQGTCNGGPCWNPTSTGFKYTDGSAANDGAKVVLLKAGAAGKAKTVVKGKGGALPLPAFSPAGLALPLTVQLQNTEPNCWSTTFTNATENDATQLKAKF